MDQPLRMGGGQPGRDLLPKLQDLHRVERPVFILPLLESFAGDVLHHQIRNRQLFDRVDGDDVLVTHRRRRTSLTQEPLARGQAQFERRPTILKRREILVGRRDEAPLVPPYIRCNFNWTEP